MSAKPKRDVHQEITNRIVNALETAGEFRLPWIKNKADSMKRPVNVATKQHYNGINVVSLWVEALAAEYPSNVWGTYKQWKDAGAQVRKDESGSLIIFYNTEDVERTDEATGETERSKYRITKYSTVFNAAQVVGFQSEPIDIPEQPLFDPIKRAEAFAAATGAIIREGGDMACFVPSLDMIRMPGRRRFTGTETTTAAEAFYSTLCHELVHWSGAKARLERDLQGRFGSESYAMEELVAELGAAFLCSDLGITPQTREDHACYIANWLKVLKNDENAVFTAAAKASEAAKWLIAKEGAA